MDVLFCPRARELQEKRILPALAPRGTRRPQWSVWRGTDPPRRCVKGGRKPRPGVRGHEQAMGTLTGKAALRQGSYSVKSRPNTTPEPPFPPRPLSQQEGRLWSPAQRLPLRWSSGPCPFNEDHRTGSANKLWETVAVPGWAAWGPAYFTGEGGPARLGTG